MVTESTTSSSWYRVAGIKPRLRTHVRLHRMRYRGELWYLLQDPFSSRVHRFTPAARLVIAAMNGERSVQQIWELVNRELGEAAPTQDEIIQLLGQLHGADLLQSDSTPDAAELFERGERNERSMRRRSYMNPMAVRVHLLDPDNFLNRVRPLINLLWSRWGGLLWLALVLPALVLVPSHWSELTGDFSDRVLAAENLALLWIVFPVIKALHEFGHAAAVKREGGEVHDLGIVMLVLIPIPYVEASAATVFRSKYYRALVGSSGMAVELAIAAICFYLWLMVEPSVMRAVLFNVMLVAGVSTLLFNGNPLLRYDAYYILADLLEMPNLATRSSKFWRYLVDRYAFGIDTETAEYGAGNRAWLIAYGLLSALYRVFVTIVIAMFIAGKFFFIGVALAIWAVTVMTVVPVIKTVRSIVDSARLREHRRRVLTVSALVVIGLATLLFVVPAPFRTVAEGVAWLPQSALVRAGNDGFLEAMVATPGKPVAAGDLLMTMSDPSLESSLRAAEARVAELEAVYAAQLVADRARAAIARDQLATEQTALESVRERFDRLRLRAQSAGVFIVPKAVDMLGRYFRQGDLLGYVVEEQQLIARVVVSQDAVDSVRSATSRVQLRFAQHPDRVVQGELRREVPGGDEYLPSRVLSKEGGGELATDPRDTKGARTLERTFQFDVAVSPGEFSFGEIFFGSRVHARFEHDPEPLAHQLYRVIRRLFLSHFHV
ncbi:MAG: HlyD family efflux transporter periplasmic adaptor subunit [Burkholderiaceae bacterium]|nr:HlyD family efflux transporter periplasmic adaptor subunit [Burkholderiaceae bacterium]